ncbi:MAG: hypothetical protein WCE44_05200 [Candidatus Velthaea sp.]|jgi:hypothetical protein
MEPKTGFFALRPLHVDLGDVVVQVVAVALGVVLGFGVTAWNEQAHQRALLRETVGNIVAELKSNQTGMHGVTGEHAKAELVFDRLLAHAKATHSVAFADAAKALRESGAVRMNIPLAIAWQIAQSDQGLTLFPYEDRYDLAWVYQLQAYYLESEQRYQNTLLSLSESPSGNYYFQVLNLSNQLHTVVSAERQLDALYTQAAARARTEFNV